MANYAWRHNPEATIGDCYSPAMGITDADEAERYFQALVARHLEFWPDRGLERAIEIEKANLGYFAGYCSDETRHRVERLFRCVHPIFGPIAIAGVPTPEEAFNAGKRVTALRTTKEAEHGT